MHDEAAWEQVLVADWGPLVRSAVVARVERATAGRRGTLVRVASDPDNARYAWTEQVHAEVMAAIRAETGADLETLGSQAAWAAYDDVWAALCTRWADGGDLRTVPASLDADVTALVHALPPDVAACVGADTGVEPYALLSVGGRLLIDVDGAHLAVAADLPGVDGARATLDRLVALLS